MAGNAAGDISGQLAADLGALSAFYAARMAAVRSSARPGDVAALIQALADEQVLAKRSAINRLSRLGADTAGSTNNHMRAPFSFAEQPRFRM